MGGLPLWVIGPDIERQLAPYQQNKDAPFDSCLNVDVLDYMKAVFLGGINCTCTVDARGKIYPPWDEVFRTDQSWGRTPPALPEGRRLKQVPAKDIMSFAQWATFYYGPTKHFTMRYKLVHGSDEQGEMTYRGFSLNGWIRIDDGGQVVEWMRVPRSQWDSWNIGYHDGSGTLMLKKGATGELKYRTGHEPPGTTYSAKKGEIDFAAMREEALHAAAIAWDAHAADQDVSDALTAANVRDRDGDVDRFNPHDYSERTREEFINSIAGSAVKLHLWIYVFESRWYEPMFMPGEHHNNPRSEWQKRTDTLWDGLPEDTLITRVSCKV